MYFPVLRGRQFELIALRELIANGLIKDNVLPIIEPVKPTSTLNTTLKAYREASARVAVIRNPHVGEFVSKLRDRDDSVIEKFYAEIDQGAFISAYYIDASSPLTTAHLADKGISPDKCIAICPNKDSLGKYRELFSTTAPLYTLISEERSMRRAVMGNKVLLADRFDKKARNTDYAIEDDQPFSEDNLYFAEEGYQGFADYSIVGAEYSESGFAPYAVVIHIVYPDEEGALRIHHFVPKVIRELPHTTKLVTQSLQNFYHIATKFTK